MSSIDVSGYVRYRYYRRNIRTMTVSEQLRELLLAELKKGTSKYRIAKNSGLTWPVIHRFARGEGLRTDQLDKLAAFFGVELTPIEPRKRK